MKVFDFIVCCLAIVLQAAGHVDLGIFILVFLTYMHAAKIIK